MISTALLVPLLATHVTVCIEPNSASQWVIQRAKISTTAMFAKIGVEIDWRIAAPNCPPGPRETILVRMVDGGGKTPSQDALGAAWLDGPPEIQVYYDRVVEFAQEATRVPELLAHVLAHEIGHVLEGQGRHSTSGIMKAHWDAKDLFQILWRPLPFAPEDVEMIRSGVLRQQSGAGSSLQPVGQ